MDIFFNTLMWYLPEGVKVCMKREQVFMYRDCVVASQTGLATEQTRREEWEKETLRELEIWALLEKSGKRLECYKREV